MNRTRRIYRPIFMIILILFALSPAEQGYYIEEEVTTPPLFGLPRQTHHTQTWITDTRLRRDEGDKNQTLLIDTENNNAWLVRHQDSTLLKMDMTTFQGLALMSMMMLGVTYDTLTGEPIIPDSIFYRTGREGRIGKWPCEEVIVHRRDRDSARKGSQPVVMWVTKQPVSDDPLYASVLRAMMGPLVQRYDAFFEQLERLGGYPAALNTRAMGMEIRQKLVKLEARDIDPGIFKLPPGYQIKDGAQ